MVGLLSRVVKERWVGLHCFLVFFFFWFFWFFLGFIFVTDIEPSLNDQRRTEEEKGG